MMKREHLIPALLLAVVLVCGFGASSLFRFSEWRSPASNVAVGSVWACTNGTTGGGAWTNGPTLNSLRFFDGETTWTFYNPGTSKFALDNSAVGQLWLFDSAEIYFSMPSTNLLGFAVFTNGYTINSLGHLPRAVTGTGGANTNFTLRSDWRFVVINGFTNVSLRAIMAPEGLETIAWPFTITITNGSGSDRLLELPATTNRWKWSYGQASTAPTVLTNGTRLVVEGWIINTNITLASYAYTSWP